VFVNSGIKNGGMPLEKPNGLETSTTTLPFRLATPADRTASNVTSPLVQTKTISPKAAASANENFAATTVSGGFQDSLIPTGFAPFDVQNIGGDLYVTYALQDAAKHDDVAGPHNGFVDVFDPNGNLLQRLISNGPLNSPWGLALAPANFGAFSNDLLVGNFGDGTEWEIQLSFKACGGWHLAMGPTNSTRTSFTSPRESLDPAAKWKITACLATCGLFRNRARSCCSAPLSWRSPFCFGAELKDSLARLAGGDSAT
jgi:hypothetical protein